MGESAPRIQTAAGGGGGSGGSRTPIQRVEAIKSRVLTPDQFEAVLLACEANTYALRDQTMLQTLYGLACRASEVVGIRWESVDWYREIRFQRPKQHDSWHAVNPPRRTWRALERWSLTAGVPRNELHGLVFKSRSGRRLRPEQVSRIWTKAAKLAGLPETKFGSHCGRHTRAVRLLEGGAKLEHVRAILGHGSFETCWAYMGVLASLQASDLSGSIDF